MFEDGETIPKYVYEAEFPPTFTEHFVLEKILTSVTVWKLKYVEV